MRKILLFIISVLVIIVILTSVNIYFMDKVYPRRLIEAIDNNDMEEFTKILEKNGNIDNRPFLWGVDRVNYPPLHYACSEGKLDYVIKLVDVGADLNNKKSTNNKTPLMCALAYNNNEQKFEIVKYLVEHGADINIKDYNETALAWVLYSNGKRDQIKKEQEFEIVKYLIEHGGNIENASAIGHFVFDVSRKNNELILQYLIEEKKIDINLIDETTGNTCLIYAAKHGANDTVRYLLGKGASVEIRNKENKSAYDLAVENEYFEIAEILKKN